MRILLQSDDEIYFLAGDGRVSERVFASVADFSLDGDLEKQIVRRVRGSHARPRARGNIRHRAFFRTARNFSTAAQAEEFVESAAATFPRKGTLYFWTGAGTRRLLDAVVPPPIARTDGSRAMLQYQVQGGEFTPLEPGEVIDGMSGTLYRIAQDSVGNWFEIGFLSPVLLEGDAETGWLDPQGFLRIRPQRSTDLVAWDHNLGTAPGTPEADGDDYIYWARMNVPIWYYNVVVDLTATSTRYGKSITDISIGGIAVSLPGYPYAMPADAAELQADLRANGYPGAVVSSVAAGLSLDIINHTYADNSYNRFVLQATLSGTNVTEVRSGGTLITLPSYPYSLPSQAATLQADLRSAGQTGAVVRLYGDAWTILLPDRPAADLLQRQEVITFTPGDPFPYWNFFGEYQGLVPDNTLTAEVGNIRPGVGDAVLTEALKQFGRFQLSAGPNHLYTP
jgi:hypothetical protein